jgi:hypothetical protein
MILSHSLLVVRKQYFVFSHRDRRIPVESIGMVLHDGHAW